MLKIDTFVKKYDIPPEGEREIIEILNESLLEISRVIMSENKKKDKVIDQCEKRYKSRKAEEYAEEHGISLEDFEIKEVSKKDVEMKVREMAKEKKEYGNNEIKRTETKRIETKEKKNGDIKREKVICSGINKKGEACKSTGTIKPNGAKKKYCFRHAEDYNLFECDSDSSEEENEEENEEKSAPPIEPKTSNEEEDLEEEDLEEEDLEEEK
tara:strand:+ start:301 stop:936 length:636 start_codon:yes stop_codon:yes gene_type:complete